MGASTGDTAGSPSGSPADNTPAARGRRHRRDRRGRGVRGPALGDVPARRTGAERFDEIALTVMEDLWARFPTQLEGIELGVEEIPLLPADWSDTVPLSTYVQARRDQPARVVLLRRPIEHRARGRAELESLVLTVLVEQVADILGISPESVHPDYPDDLED